MLFFKKNTNNYRLLVIDGTSLVVTNFYGGIPIYIQNEKNLDKLNALCRKELRQTKNGIYTHAVVASILNILGLMRFYDATHVAVCFDKNSKTTFRKQMYPAYKETRHPKPDALKESVETTRTILKNIGIPSFWSDQFEADDLAGSLINQFKYDCDKVLFVTKDHDWLQFIDGNVKGVLMQSSEDRAVKMRELYKALPENDDMADPFHLRTYRKCVTFDENVTYANDGVYPMQIIDLKALAGDTSDNIPGVKGIGDKTASQILSCFQSIESLYAAIDACKKIDTFGNETFDENALSELAKKMKQFGVTRNPLSKLIAGRSDALLSKKLATINCNIPINFDIARLEPHINPDMVKRAIDYYEMDELQYLIDNEVSR